MSSNISGFQNEKDLISDLNGKKIKDLNDNLKNFINFLFSNLNGNEIISTYNGKKGQKPDMIIQIDNEIKKVSVKMGSGNSVHQENIDLFIEYLESINISKETQIELLKFHWGDGTVNGTGNIRISSADYKKENEDKINLINTELNKKDSLLKIVNRILFQGKSEKYDIVDAVYYGNSKLGHWATKEEILNYISLTSFKSDSIHFGPLNYQIWNRCLNFNPKTENRRKVMQVKWASLLQDILNIERKRNNNV